MDTSPFVYYAVISFVDLKSEKVRPSPCPLSFKEAYEISIF
jgi:hypothetical protein